MINASRCPHRVAHGTTKQARNDRENLYWLDCLFSPDRCPISKPLAPGGFTVAITDELSDEEQAIMRFLKRYFAASGMPNALWILNESENISDVRAVLQAYREFYKSHGIH